MQSPLGREASKIEPRYCGRCQRSYIGNANTHSQECPASDAQMLDWLARRAWVRYDGQDETMYCMSQPLRARIRASLASDASGGTTAPGSTTERTPVASSGQDHPKKCISLSECPDFDRCFALGERASADSVGPEPASAATVEGLSDDEEEMSDEALVYFVSVALMRLDGNEGDPHQLVWCGGLIPEPWGDVWQKYEPQAKALIDAIGESSAREFASRLAAQAGGEVRALTDERIATLEYARDYIYARDHGDNCYVSAHYEGDPGDRCNCGMESVLQNIESAIEAEVRLSQPSKGE